jgi:hypothetical protein
MRSYLNKYKGHDAMKTLLLPPLLTLLLGALPLSAANFYIAQDTDLYQGTGNPTGSTDDLDVASSFGAGHDMYTFLQFDLSPSGFGSGSEVTNATLWLYTESVTTAGTINLRHVTGAWDDSTITWATQPTVGSFDLTSVNVTTAGAWYGFDITSLFQMWVDTPSINLGVRLSSTGAQVKFESSEDSGSGVQPYINAVPEPSTYALLMLGAGAVYFVRRRSRQS